MGFLTTALGTRIPVPLTIKEERQQLRETLQRSTVEKRMSNIPFLEGAGPSRLEVQRKALEEPLEGREQWRLPSQEIRALSHREEFSLQGEQLGRL